MTYQIIERHKRALSFEFSLFHVRFKFNEKAYILGQRPGGKNIHGLGKPNLRFAIPAFLIKMPNEIPANPKSKVIGHIIKRELSQPLFANNATIFRTGQLIAIFQESLAECVEAWGTGMADITIQGILPSKGRNRMRRGRHDHPEYVHTQKEQNAAQDDPHCWEPIDVVHIPSLFHAFANR